MIPKIIHYCWFGHGEMPELALRCIASWRQYMPDYELRLWNEDSFDITSYPYTREAYDARKFAFVSDVVRLWALERYGGIYMDTDVEILKPLDDLLHLPAFIGYEASKSQVPGTGLMATEPHGIWVKEQLSCYADRHFVLQDGSMDLTTNPIAIARKMREEGFVFNGKYGVYKGNMHVFPVDYFCPLTSTRVLKCTKNTYCIHHFAGSWKEKTRGQFIKDWFCDHVLSRQMVDRLVRVKRKCKEIL